MFISEDVAHLLLRGMLIVGKYFQALGALCLANKITRGDGQVVHQVGMLKEKIAWSGDEAGGSQRSVGENFIGVGGYHISAVYLI